MGKIRFKACLQQKDPEVAQFSTELQLECKLCNSEQVHFLVFK